MSSKSTSLLFLAMLLLIAGNLFAQQAGQPEPTTQDDKYGKVDTIFAEPYKIDAKHWAINVSMWNDEDIIAMSLPFKFEAGKGNRVVADSTIFTGGRAESFRVKMARPDTAVQCVTIGLIADVGVSVPPIPPGKGRLATVFISSLDNKEISALNVDTTTTYPSNSLQLVKQPSDGILPAFVVLKSAGKEAPKEVKQEEKKTEGQ